MGLPALLPAVPGLGPRVWRWIQPSSTIASVVTRSGRTLVLPLPLPMVLVLAANLATSYLCKWGVLSLMARTSSTTSTLAITVYRVASLLVSLLIFNSPPAPRAQVWGGAVLVFTGSLMYVATNSRQCKRRRCKRKWRESRCGRMVGAGAAAVTPAATPGAVGADAVATGGNTTTAGESK